MACCPQLIMRSSLDCKSVINCSIKYSSSWPITQSWIRNNCACNLSPAAFKVSCNSRKLPEVSSNKRSQLEIAACQSLVSKFAISSLMLCWFSSITRCDKSILSKISATEYFNGAKTFRRQKCSFSPFVVASSAASDARWISSATIESCTERRNAENSRWRI